MLSKRQELFKNAIEGKLRVQSRESEILQDQIIEEIKETEHTKTEEALQLVRKEHDLWMYQNEKEEAKRLQSARKQRKDEEMAWAPPRPEITTTSDAVESTFVDLNGESRPEQVEARLSRREREREAPGERSEVIKSPKRNVIRVESEETQEYERKAKSAEQKEMEERSFVPGPLKKEPTVFSELVRFGPSISAEKVKVCVLVGLHMMAEENSWRSDSGSSVSSNSSSENNVGNDALFVVGLHGSRDTIALFLHDWEVAKVALSHIALDMLCQEMHEVERRRAGSVSERVLCYRRGRK